MARGNRYSHRLWPLPWLSVVHLGVHVEPALRVDRALSVVSA
jgi:hypothetical protein